jgi:hypothetical protein
MPALVRQGNEVWALDFTKHDYCSKPSLNTFVSFTMKVITIILISILVLFVASQVWSSMNTEKTESHKYEVLKKFDSIEIRKYAPAMFSYVVMEASSYKSVSSNGFQKLAGYIFGGNEENKKIAMTSPVSMEMDDSITMKFKIPEGMDSAGLPKPNNPNVRFKSEPAKTVAAIRFGGWSSDEKIAEYTQKLKDVLAKNGVKHNGKFSYLGYNPPFELVNRRNEIVVEVEGY